VARRWLKTLTHKEFWRMRYSEDASDPAKARFCERKSQQLRASATPAKLRINRKRADFRQICAVAFEGHTTHNTLLMFVHKEMVYIFLDFIFSARQQQSLIRVPGDQFKDRTSV
jgi:hypothetical protein